MEIYAQQNRFDIEFTYNPHIVKYVKAIGARWNGKNWWLPAHETAKVDALRKKFCKGNDVALQPERYGDIPPLPDLSPEHEQILSEQLLRPPYHYQKQGVAYNLKFKKVMNADDMGGGKTTTSIATIVAAGLKNKCGLVVCKGSGKFMWEREFKVVAGMKSAILTDAVKTTWYQFHELAGVSVFITNYESLEKFFVERIVKPKDKALAPEHIIWKMHPAKGKPMKDLFEYVILDESHEIRNEDTLKSVICVGLGIGKEYRLALSGTPIVNKSKDIYAQLNFLGKTKNTKESKKAFMDRYCGGNGSKSTNSKELHYNLNMNCYFRRNKKEFGIELPDLTMQLIYSEIENRKEYHHCENNLADYLKSVKGKTDSEVEKSMNGEIMVQIQSLMKISAMGRIKETIEAIDEVLQMGEKVVVGFHHREIKEEFKKHYRYLFEQKRAFIISGDENAIQKNEAELAFKNLTGHGVVFVSIKAGGVGLNLQTASYIIDHELPWHPAIFYQFIARVHRNGQLNKVNAKIPIGKNTIDERIWEIIESKKDIADTITGGDDSDIQRQIIDKVRESLFNPKNKAE